MAQIVVPSSEASSSYSNSIQILRVLQIISGNTRKLLSPENLRRLLLFQVSFGGSGGNAELQNALNSMSLGKRTSKPAAKCYCRFGKPTRWGLDTALKAVEFF